MRILTEFIKENQMKKIFLFIIIIITGVVVLVSSCSKDLTERTGDASALT
jgi:uncharacterized alpha/beta hydrolase family protein